MVRIHVPRAVPITLAALLALSACGTTGKSEGNAGGDVLPFRQIRLIVPFDPGGGMSISALQIQPTFEKYLGKKLSIQSVPGGGTAVGSAVAARDGKDCSTILHNPIPHLNFAWLLQSKVGFTDTSFAMLGRLYYEGTAIVVSKDSPWLTLQDLVADAKKRPGEISFSTSALSSPFYLALLDLEKAAGIDLKIVNYEGGGPARTAVLSGEVDGTAVAVYAMQPAIDDLRVLSVQADTNDWPELTQNAPTSTEALGEDVPQAITTEEGFFVSAECKENYPKRYQALVDALEKAAHDPSYQTILKKTNEEGKFGGSNYLPPEEYTQHVHDEVDILKERIANTPELAKLAAEGNG